LIGPYRRGDRVDVFELRQIACDGRDVLADYGHRLVQFRLPTRDDEHVCALFYEPLGCSEADSAISACDHRYFSRQCAHKPLLIVQIVQVQSILE
jgi:hypothetical protein